MYAAEKDWSDGHLVSWHSYKKIYEVLRIHSTNEFTHWGRYDSEVLNLTVRYKEIAIVGIWLFGYVIQSMIKVLHDLPRYEM